jgi:hypothetical protein
MTGFLANRSRGGDGRGRGRERYGGRGRDHIGRVLPGVHCGMDEVGGPVPCQPWAVRAFYCKVLRSKRPFSIDMDHSARTHCFPPLSEGSFIGYHLILVAQ